MANYFVSLNNNGILEISDDITITNIISTNITSNDITSNDISSNTLNISNITSNSPNILFDNKNLTTIGNISANTLEISNITSNSQDNILFNKNILIGITNNSDNYGLLIYNKKLAIQNSSGSGSDTTLKFIHGVRTVSNYLNSDGNMSWTGSQSNYNFDKQLIINTSGYGLSNGTYSYNLPSSNGTLLSYDTNGLLSIDNITLNGNITFEGFPSSPNKTLNLYGTGHYIKAYYNDDNHDGVEIKGWSMDKDKSAVRFLTGNTTTSTDSNNITLMNMYYDRIRSYKKLQISQFETVGGTSLINSSSQAKHCHLFIGGYEWSTLNQGVGGSTKIGFGFIRTPESTVPAYIGIRQETDDDQTKASIVFATRGDEYDNNPTTERMCITSAGNVGIGTTNPSAKLDVNGDIIASGSLTISGSSTFNDKIQVRKVSIGHLGHGDNGTLKHAGFAYETLYNTTQYGYLHRSDGSIYINCTTGSVGINFRVNNGTPSKMIMDTNGNLGIGIQAPSAKLHVNGNVYIENGSLDLTYHGSASYIGQSAIGNVGHSSDYAGFAHRDVLSFSTDYALLQEDTGETFLNCKLGKLIRFRQGNSDMMLLQNGNLDVYGNLGVNGNITINKTNTSIEMIGAWDNGNYHRICGHNTDKRIEFNYTHGTILSDNSTVSLKTNNANRITIISNGNVGIGTTNPTVPLELSGLSGDNYRQNGSYVKYRFPDNPLHRENTSAVHRIALQLNDGNIFMAGGPRTLYVSSDSRIKTNIVDVPDNLALEQLRNIPCRYYEYIDKFIESSDKTIGFIAQEVKKILPMAVSQTKQIIPNVYKIINSTWTSSNNTFTMTSSDLENINGIKYRFYVSNETDGSDEEKIEIIGNSDNTFTFDTQYNNVFCYGSEVDDFNILDKNKLFTLNFSATQEIDKIQQTHITKIERLEAENNELKLIIHKLKIANSFEEFKNSL